MQNMQPNERNFKNFKLLISLQESENNSAGMIENFNTQPSLLTGFSSYQDGYLMYLMKNLLWSE